MDQNSPLNGILTLKGEVLLWTILKRSTITSKSNHQGLFEFMGNIGEIKNKTKFNYEGEKIYAFKPQPHRFLCFFFYGNKVIVTNAFHKKTNKLPVGEKQRTLKCKEDYEVRVNRGDYYE